MVDWTETEFLAVLAFDIAAIVIAVCGFQGGSPQRCARLRRECRAKLRKRLLNQRN